VVPREDVGVVHLHVVLVPGKVWVRCLGTVKFWHLEKVWVRYTWGNCGCMWCTWRGCPWVWLRVFGTGFGVILGEGVGVIPGEGVGLVPDDSVIPEQGVGVIPGGGVGDVVPGEGVSPAGAVGLGRQVGAGTPRSPCTAA
jgi:hypothetical protein